VQSQPGLGSTFTVSLPPAGPAAAPQASRTGAPNPARAAPPARESAACAPLASSAA